jgi:hypothetical protein
MVLKSSDTSEQSQEIHTTVNIYKTTIFRDVTPYSVVDV